MFSLRFVKIYFVLDEIVSYFKSVVFIWRRISSKMLIFLFVAYIIIRRLQGISSVWGNFLWTAINQSGFRHQECRQIWSLKTFLFHSNSEFSAYLVMFKMYFQNWKHALWKLNKLMVFSNSHNRNSSGTLLNRCCCINPLDSFNPSNFMPCISFQSSKYWSVVL